MGRAIAAVIVGYIVMAAFVMLSLSIAWSVMGPEQAFEPGTTTVTGRWLAVNFPLSLVGAVLGGYVARIVARRDGPVKVLAGLILVLGLVLAVAHLYVDVPGGEEAAAGAAANGELSGFEAASEAVQPTWYNFAIPWVGVVGVLWGGRLGRRR